MKTLLITLVAVAGMATVGTPGQEVTSRALTVDFHAFGADGRLLDALNPSDVDLRIDGKRREVTSVRRIAAAARAVTAASGVRAPYGTSADSASGRTFVFVLDENSFGAGREQPFRSAVAGLLGRMTASDFVSVVGLPYGGVKVPLTNDHAKARHAIDMASGQRTAGETGSQMACRTRLVLESLETLLREMSGRTIPTTVVLLTAGLSPPRRDAPMSMAPGMCEIVPDVFRRVGVAAGAARANFYIAQPDDIQGVAAPGVESIGGVGFTGSENPLAGIEDLSGTTRAVRLPLTALGENALDRVDADSSAYFVASFEPQLQDFDPRSRRLEIRIDRPDVTVRVRSEITFTRPRAGTSAATRVSVTDMLMSTATFAELPIRASAYAVGTVDGMVQVVAHGEPEDRTTSLASVGAVLVNGDGAIVARWSAVDADERPLVGAMRVPPGRYRLRMAAVDSAGRGGAADYRFEAALTQVGPLALGDLVLGLSRAGQLIPRLEFSDEPAALASFEIYGGTPGMPVTALLELSRTPDGPPLATVPLAIEAQRPGHFVAMGTVPLGALPTGDYVVRGLVRLEKGTVGRTIRTLRKIR